MGTTLFVNAIHIRKNNRVHQHLSNTKEVKTEDTNEFNSHLPIVTIDTHGLKIPGESRDGSTIKTDVKIYDTKGNRNNYLTDIPALETSSITRIRGASSRRFDKKNYLLRFINENETKNYQSVMGMGEHYEWVLHGPFLDKTLIRNYMWYNIGAEIMGYAPNVRFCELFINQEYKGLYVMMDSVSMGEERIEIAEAADDDIACSYIIRLDRGSSNPYRNLTKHFRALKGGARNEMDLWETGLENSGAGNGELLASYRRPGRLFFSYRDRSRSPRRSRSFYGLCKISGPAGQYGAQTAGDTGERRAEMAAFHTGVCRWERGGRFSESGGIFL